ncbi:MAG: hypothetical protein HZA49_02775 [Planctomycetes bacterium]|nr:hypothetical protein [Planctomycetota bacterium]
MDYIPKTDAEFDEWLRNFSANIGPIGTALGLPAAQITAAVNAYPAWQVLYVAHQSAQDAARSAAEDKDAGRDTAKDTVRPVAGMAQKHPELTDGQRATLRITVWDTNPTPISPDYVLNLTPPILLLDWKQRGQVTIHFGVNPSNEKRNAKPKDIAGARIFYRIESGPWVYVADDTNSPYLHNLGITEPTNVEYRAQWFDKRIRFGPFGETAKCTVSP